MRLWSEPRVEDGVEEALGVFHVDIRALRPTEALISVNAIPDLAKRTTEVHIPALGYALTFQTLAVHFNAARNITNHEAFRKALLYVCHEVFVRSCAQNTPEVLMHGANEFIHRIQETVKMFTHRERVVYMKLINHWIQRFSFDLAFVRFLQNSFSLRLT